MKREVMIQQVRTQNKTTYADAVKMVAQSEGQDGRMERSRARMEPAEMEEPGQGSTGKVMVDVEN